MGVYAARRLIQLVPVLLLVSTAVFFVFRIVPGDVATQRLGENATPEALAALRRAWGLDRPLPLQYLSWLGGVLRGDFGESYLDKQPVLSVLLEKLPAPIELALAGSLLGLALSLPAGIMAALLRGTWLDHLLRLIALVGFCMPRYW